MVSHAVTSKACESETWTWQCVCAFAGEILNILCAFVLHQGNATRNRRLSANRIQVNTGISCLNQEIKENPFARKWKRTQWLAAAFDYSNIGIAEEIRMGRWHMLMSEHTHCNGPIWHSGRSRKRADQSSLQISIWNRRGKELWHLRGNKKIKMYFVLKRKTNQKLKKENKRCNGNNHNSHTSATIAKTIRPWRKLWSICAAKNKRDTKRLLLESSATTNPLGFRNTR
jgi:hypothetical protein